MSCLVASYSTDGSIAFMFCYCFGWWWNSAKRCWKNISSRWLCVCRISLIYVCERVHYFRRTFNTVYLLTCGLILYITYLVSKGMPKRGFFHLKNLHLHIYRDCCIIFHFLQLRKELYSWSLADEKIKRVDHKPLIKYINSRSSPI